ncbi:hypothetical protein ACEQ8H_005784 [Pleosporales sp. CAS-2024a]
MYKSVALSAIASLVAIATAHGTTDSVIINGVSTTGFKLDFYYAKQNGGQIPEHIGWYAENLDNGFVEPNSFHTGDIICHKNASPDGSSDTLAKVPAGGSVNFHWTTWPESHIGPIITYVAPYSGDIASVKKTDLKWTKIQANGFENGEWAAVKMIGQNNTWPVTVPANLKAGKYVFRHEIIALHSANQPNGAQAYPQCLNMEVTGDGTTVPEGVAGTSLYKADDAGILFDPYKQPVQYTIPGPALFGAGSGSGSAPATTTQPSGGVASPSASAAPVASSTPAPSPGAGESSDGLPKEFTIETFISWLESKASGKARRRHARAFAT